MIKPETLKRHQDLSTVEGTLTQIFANNSQLLYSLYNDEELSTYEFKQSMLYLIDKAKSTSKVKLIRMKVENMAPTSESRKVSEDEDRANRANILSYFANIMLSGMGMPAC